MLDCMLRSNKFTSLAMLEVTGIRGNAYQKCWWAWVEKSEISEMIFGAKTEERLCPGLLFVPSLVISGVSTLSAECSNEK